jgi:aminopeptidase S
MTPISSRLALTARAIAILGLVVGGSLGSLPGAVAAAPPGPDIDVAAVRADLDSLQQVATVNGGNRATGTPGYRASSDLIAGRLESAGLVVSRQPFRTRAGTTWNLSTEIPGQDPTRVVMVGAHLDSVTGGPGINDDGSGSAAVLEIALALRQDLPAPAVTIRFVWWSGEELGLLGSRYYVDNASATDLTAIQAYLNLDMIGSPNAGYFVYDDDPTIERLYQDYFTALGVPTEIETEGDGRSDHAPFKDAGVPVGGLFSGADYLKTPAQARAWGGTAGRAFDACYHRSCDTTANIDLTSLDRMTDATASVLFQLANLASGPRARSVGVGPG